MSASPLGLDAIRVCLWQKGRTEVGMKIFHPLRPLGTSPYRDYTRGRKLTFTIYLCKCINSSFSFLDSFFTLASALDAVERVRYFFK